MTVLVMPTPPMMTAKSAIPNAILCIMSTILLIVGRLRRFRDSQLGVLSPSWRAPIDLPRVLELDLYRATWKDTFAVQLASASDTTTDLQPLPWRMPTMRNAPPGSRSRRRRSLERLGSLLTSMISRCSSSVKREHLSRTGLKRWLQSAWGHSQKRKK